MTMESNGPIYAACLDAINAFGEIERSCITATLLVNPTLHTLIPMFKMPCERGSGELWCYDENGNFVDLYYNRNGVRHGCAMGAFFFCLAICPVYARLQALLGPEGALYAYSDDVYSLYDVVGMTRALATAPAIYKKVGLRIGWGPRKTELILPSGCEPDAFLSQLEAYGAGLPHVVPGFSCCLGVPHHASNDYVFITSALTNIDVHHDRLLDLVEDIVDEDPFVALRLLQVCGVNRFGHLTSAVPPPLIQDFAAARDDAVNSTFAAI